MQLGPQMEPPAAVEGTDQACYTQMYFARSLVKAAPMLTVLFLAECSGICAAMSIVAWQGDPSNVYDFGRAVLLRFLAPPLAVVLGLVTLSELQKWLMGEQVGEQPPVSWVLIGGGFLAASVAFVIAVVRQRRAYRQGLDSRDSWSQYSVMPSQRRHSRLLKGRKGRKGRKGPR